MPEDIEEEQSLWTAPTWFPLGAYDVGDIVRYDMAVYRCKEAHYGETEWNPKDCPRLWERIR